MISRRIIAPTLLALSSSSSRQFHRNAWKRSVDSGTGTTTGRSVFRYRMMMTHPDDGSKKTEKETTTSTMVDFINPDDTTIRTILTQTRTVAMIGASNRPERDSYHVMEYLMNECGYTVIPINPMYSDTMILNQKVYSTLTEVLQTFPHVDMIDIFRRSSDVPEIMTELFQYQQQQQKLHDTVDDGTANVVGTSKQQQFPRYIWMQINVIDPISAKLAQQQGYTVVMNKCPLHEIPRLQVSLPIIVPL